MLKIQSTSDLQQILDGVKANTIFSIKETLRNRNHGLIDFNNTITNNRIDHVDKENITGYSIDEDTVQVEMCHNYYNISIDNLKVEVLLEILQAIEAEEYTDALADDDEE
jgi:hypothetical protein